jgi:hypothetical protein
MRAQLGIRFRASVFGLYRSLAIERWLFGDWLLAGRVGRSGATFREGPVHGTGNSSKIF